MRNKETMRQLFCRHKHQRPYSYDINSGVALYVCRNCGKVITTKKVRPNGNSDTHRTKLHHKYTTTQEGMAHE